MKTVALISGGKDSCYNMVQCVAEGHQIVALANLKPKDRDELDSYMYQSVGHHAIELYAEAMGLPLFRRTIQGSSQSTGRDYSPTEEDEVEDLFELLKRVKEELQVEAVSVGAILSDYQRVRVENVCMRLGLTPLAYLWRRNQEELLDEMILSGINAIIIKVAAMGLDPDKHLGKSLREMQRYLLTMKEKYDLNVCGEGGEYETFTLDCPLFKKKIVIDESELVLHSADAFAPVGYLNLHKAHLENKGVTHIQSQLECVRDLPIYTSHNIMEEVLTQEEIGKVKMETCLNCDKLHELSIDQILADSPSIRVVHRGNELWVSGIRAMYKPDKCIKQLTTEAMEKLKDVCSEGWDLSCMVLVHLYVNNMADFADINSVYKTYFGMNPAARVCVQASLPKNVALQIDCYGYLSHTDRQTMHVQGLSHWAPANIGPYSQAVKISGKVYIAGQIGMVPASLQLIQGGIIPQCRLSLRHVQRVLAAMSPGGSLCDVTSCVCYVTHPAYIPLAKEEWKRANKKEDKWKEDGCDGPYTPLCCIQYVIVPNLPKGALVEWQVIAVTSGSLDKEYLVCDGLDSKLSCVKDGNTVLSLDGTIYKCAYVCQGDDLGQPDVKKLVEIFMDHLKRQRKEWGCSSLPSLRIFYPHSAFKYTELFKELENCRLDNAFCLVPVQALENECSLLSFVT